MELSYIVLIISLSVLSFSTTDADNAKLFREYIGAESSTIKLTDVPISSEVEFHFILAFAIDYTTSNPTSPTNGIFNVFWDSDQVGPNDIASIKDKYSNVKVAVSLGGDSVSGNANKKAFFALKSVSSWVQNAVSSLTSIITQYGLDGIDIDYEHFHSDPDTFAECIGQLIASLKRNKTISFASIAPYDDSGPVQSHYRALWQKYGHIIDYVNFQFYAYNKLSVSQFVGHFNEQASNYGGGQLLASVISGGESGGLSPENGFFEACKELMSQEKLGGIAIWCADESTKYGFKYEKASQALLASA